MSEFYIGSDAGPIKRIVLIVDDGDDVNAASVDPTFQDLIDNSAYIDKSMLNLNAGGTYTFTTSVTWANPTNINNYVVIAPTGVLQAGLTINSPGNIGLNSIGSAAIAVQGVGTIGVLGLGKAGGNGSGGVFTGDGTAEGVVGTGGTNGPGGRFVGGGTDATDTAGILAFGRGNGSGINAYAKGTGAVIVADGTVGPSSGHGIIALAGTSGAGAHGVQATGHGTGSGVAAQGGAGGPGVNGTGGSGMAGVRGNAGSGTGTPGVESLGGPIRVAVGTSSPSTDPGSGMIWANSLVQVAGTVVTDGAGGITSALGFGFTASISGNFLRITFARSGGMSSTAYFANGSLVDSSGDSIVVAKTTGHFDIDCSSADGSVPKHPANTVLTISVLAVGQAA